MPGYIIDANDPAAIGAWYRIDCPIPSNNDFLSTDGVASALKWLLAPLGVWADQVAYKVLGSSIFIGNTNEDPTWPASQAEVVAADLDAMLAHALGANELSWAYDYSPTAGAYSCGSSDPLDRGVAAAAAFTILARQMASGVCEDNTPVLSILDNGTDIWSLIITLPTAVLQDAGWDPSTFNL